MADEKTPDSGDDTSLSDTLEAAFEADEKAQAEPIEETPVEAQEAEAAPEAEASEDTPVGAPEAEEQPEPSPLTPPEHWAAQDKEVFASQSREAQEWLLEKSKSLEKGYDEKFREVAALKKAAEPWDNYLRSVGATPEQAFGYLMNAEYQLRNGTADQKRQLLHKFASDYGIELTQAETAAAEESEALDPTIKALRDELGQVKNVLNQQSQAQTQAQQSAMLAEIETFSKQTTEAGEPAHPFFDDVLEEITARARFDLAQGRKPDLAKLYDAAVYANPDTRQRMLDASKEAEARKQAEAAKAKAKAAEKAAVSVKGAPAGGSAPVEPKSLRDSIEAAMAEAS